MKMSYSIAGWQPPCFHEIAEAVGACKSEEDIDSLAAKFRSKYPDSEFRGLQPVNPFGRSRDEQPSKAWETFDEGIPRVEARFKDDDDGDSMRFMWILQFTPKRERLTNSKGGFDKETRLKNLGTTLRIKARSRKVKL